jgi:HSP20 family protein
MALTPWLVSRDPFFQDPFSILDNFSTNFDSSLTPQQGRGSEGARRVSAFARAPVDVREKDNQYIFEADLPGLTKDEVKVQLEEDGKVLAISGERKHNFEEKKEGQNYHRIERSYGKFERRFRLPENASSSEIKASAKDGVLTVTIPKQKPKENKTVDVQVQ